MEALGLTQSVCPECRALVPAKVLAEGGNVFFRKFCPRHGESEVLVRSGTAEYLAAQRFVKPAWVPREAPGDADKPCPEGCGFCARHEQHLCLPIVEISSRCDLRCPICLVDAGGARDLSLAEFNSMLDGLVRSERQIDVLNLSGGEPLLHPEFLAVVDAALARPEVVRVSVSTNGLGLLSRPELAAELRERNVVVSLQFDGFREDIYERLRGRRLLAEKLRILDLLGAADASTSLTMTAAAGVNDDQFGRMLDLFFSREHLVSMMVQPLAFAGRGRALARDVRRLTIPDVVRLLGEAGHPAVRAADFAPLPCSHPLCFSLAFYLMLNDGRPVSINGLVEAGTMMDAVANRTVFGLEPGDYERLRDLVYRLWSGPAASAPDAPAVMETVRGLLRETACSRFDPRKAFGLAERRVKSIFIHGFQDADSFDLARARRCCNGYPQPDGRVIPACVHNVLRRGR